MRAHRSRSPHTVADVRGCYDRTDELVRGMPNLDSGVIRKDDIEVCREPSAYLRERLAEEPNWSNDPMRKL